MSIGKKLAIATAEDWGAIDSDGDNRRTRSAAPPPVPDTTSIFNPNSERSHV
jgi:hypothetical protein